MGDVRTGYELDDDEEYWKAVETEEITLIEQEDDEPEDITEQSKTQVEALARIVSWTALPQPHVINVVPRNKSYASVS
jgi:anaerobic C4-dicarboxylate transporter